MVKQKIDVAISITIFMFMGNILQAGSPEKVKDGIGWSYGNGETRVINYSSGATVHLSCRINGSFQEYDEKMDSGDTLSFKGMCDVLHVEH
ncbi:MAG: hypothetical protein LBQ34_03175 [Alphaproteobacteria bacterium]|jgi:hypothetical protein|nr:hypothetical protein [Alphaproteobacteria bacterium]